MMETINILLLRLNLLVLQVALIEKLHKSNLERTTTTCKTERSVDETAFTITPTSASSTVSTYTADPQTNSGPTITPTSADSTVSTYTAQPQTVPEELTTRLLILGMLPQKKEERGFLVTRDFLSIPNNWGIV